MNQLILMIDENAIIDLQAVSGENAISREDRIVFRLLHSVWTRANVNVPVQAAWKFRLAKYLMNVFCTTDLDEKRLNVTSKAKKPQHATG